MFKNPSIKFLASVITFIAVLTMCLVFTVVNLNYDLSANLVWLVGIVMFSGIIIYFTTLAILRQFVFRKIKLIYKTIHKSKLGMNQSKENRNVDEAFQQIDTSVQEWAEDTQSQLNNLKALEEYRKNFVGNISHELKTPIFSVQGYLHTLLDGGLYDENINMKYTRRAAENADRLQSIVEDLEEIGKLESGKFDLDLSEIRIKDLVEEVFSDLFFAAKEKGISLLFKSTARNNFLVHGDKEKVRQVLNNLIGNSIKYGSEGGSTVVSLYDMDQNILVEIKDSGMGIEEKHLPHLFDRFYRVDSNRSRKEGGSGLGLSIVKHIIEAHNQTINVRSSVGIGTTFGFTLKKV